MLLSVLLFLNSAGAVPTRSPLPRDGGEALYLDNCWQCHGKNALGDGPLSEAIPSPALAGRVSSGDFPALTATIQHGSGDMPGFSQVLNTTESRWILMWLEGLDPITGIDPRTQQDTPDPETPDPETPDPETPEPEGAAPSVPEGI